MKTRVPGLVVSWWLAMVAPTLLFLPCPANAQKSAGSYPDEMGTLYLGNGQALAAIKPRLLTKNAHISEFECAPTGTRVAYISEDDSNGQALDEALSIATVERGDNTVYAHGQIPGDFQGIVLRGWSDDAAYLAFGTEADVPDFSQPRASVRQHLLHIIDLVHGSVFDASLPFDQLIPPAGPNDPPQRYTGGALWSSSWAPGVRLMAIMLKSYVLDGPGDFAICLYDPDRKSSQILIKQTDALRLDGWQDATHLAYSTRNGHFIYDLASGKSTSVPATPKLLRGINLPWSDASIGGSESVRAPNNETLSLTENSYTLAAANGDKVDTNAILLTRTGGPARVSKLQLDSFPRVFGIGGAQFLQNGGFDRNGVYHVLYESEGDLKVVDLLPRAASPQEKLAGGDKLTCDEEIEIAESDAKQIGLGILQSVMDFDETFPSADGFHDRVYPYIKSDDVFTSPNGTAFHYDAPADPKLADMASTADTALGEFDLPCAKVVLYGDGHVKVEENNPPGSLGVKK